MKPGLKKNWEAFLARIQPTYEELKQRVTQAGLSWPLRIQPTYEELKRDDAGKAVTAQLCIQPTYEELKLC